MILRKKWLAMFFVMTLAVVLAACGSNDSNTNETEETQDADVEEVEDENTEEELSSREREESIDGPEGSDDALEMKTLSEMADEGSVWYYVKEDDLMDIGKESDVDQIIVFKDGVLNTFFLDDIQLGDLDDMSDDEVIEYGKESLSEKHQDLAYENEPYKWKLYTDNSGNMTERMSLNPDSGKDRLEKKLSSKKKFNYYSIDDKMQDTVEVYSNLYTGFYSEQGYNNYFMLKKIEDPSEAMSFGLDEPSTDNKDIEVDPELIN